MTKDELIAKQQLEIENLKLRVIAMRIAFRNIELICICTNGPLNGNTKGYTSKQMVDFQSINEYVNEGLNPDITQ